MDPRNNPFAPGAGTPPPELSGRDDLIERAAIAIDRIRLRNPARSLILHGLRGVGKTVLLNHIRIEAESRGITTIRLEAPEARSLPSLLAPNLRMALLRLSRGEARKLALQRAWQALAGFVGSLKVTYQDIEVSLDVEPELGLADTGDFELDLVDLLTAVGEAAAEQKTAIVIVLDELQYVPKEQLAALIRALHSISQDVLPITMLAAGLPQIIRLLGDAKSYAERLFEFARIDRLEYQPASNALSKPVEREGVVFDKQAIEEVYQQTQGYPYFLQEWGKHSWNLAENSLITLDDVRQAAGYAQAELDASFFQMRFDRLTKKEKTYLRAMAELGAGPHRSGEVANVLGQKVTSVAKLRKDMIGKGVIYGSEHGETAFTVPLFDDFMKRIMPTLEDS
ncbi:MAG TPA: ATP-binding protein [Bacteroidetes bacterium]|nr:archaeal ATPase [bacterium BMS3Bbin04]HDO65944.1 ATP-binding protein [Bacteroidota bacterium]HEX05069.1 ATP-binding protein [Bacteroidota bacterium]